MSNSDPTLSRIAAGGRGCRPPDHVTYLIVYMKDIEIFSSNFDRKYIMSKDGTTNYHIGLKRRHVYYVTADV